MTNKEAVRGNGTYLEYLKKAFSAIEERIEVLQKNRKMYRIEEGSNVTFEDGYYEIGKKIDRLNSFLDELDVLIDKVQKEE